MNIPTYVITMIGESLSEQLAQECIDSAKKFGIQPEIFPATHGDDVDKHFKAVSYTHLTLPTKRIV